MNANWLYLFKICTTWEKYYKTTVQSGSNLGFLTKLHQSQFMLIFYKDVRKTIELWMNCLWIWHNCKHRLLDYDERIIEDAIKIKQNSSPSQLSRKDHTKYGFALAAAWGPRLCGYLSRSSWIHHKSQRSWSIKVQTEVNFPRLTENIVLTLGLSFLSIA